MAVKANINVGTSLSAAINKPSTVKVKAVEHAETTPSSLGIGPTNDVTFNGLTVSNTPNIPGFHITSNTPAVLTELGISNSPSKIPTNNQILSLNSPQLTNPEIINTDLTVIGVNRKLKVRSQGDNYGRGITDTQLGHGLLKIHHVTSDGGTPDGEQPNNFGLEYTNVGITNTFKIGHNDVGGASGFGNTNVTFQGGQVNLNILPTPSNAVSGGAGKDANVAIGVSGGVDADSKGTLTVKGYTGSKISLTDADGGTGFEVTSTNAASNMRMDLGKLRIVSETQADSEIDVTFSNTANGKIKFPTNTFELPDLALTNSEIIYRRTTNPFRNRPDREIVIARNSPAISASGSEEIAFQSQNSPGVAASSTHYAISVSSSGSTQHQWSISNTPKMTLQSSGALSLSNTPLLPGLNLVDGSNTPAIRTQLGINNTPSATILADINNTPSGSLALSASQITSDTFANARIHQLSVAQYEHTLNFSPAQITSLNNTPSGSLALSASKITSDTFANARISQRSVAQHESTLNFSPAQISGLNNTPSSNILSSPSLTGIPLAPTASSPTNTTQIATTAFVQTRVATKIAELVDTAPATLNTLNELAEALNDSPAQINDILTKLGEKVTKTNNLSDVNATLARTNLGLGNVENKSASTIIGEITASDIPNLAASKITSGTFANARIHQLSVAQHQNTLNFSPAQISDLNNTPSGSLSLTASQVGLGTSSSPTFGAINIIGTSDRQPSAAPIFVKHDYSNTHGFGIAISRDDSTTASVGLGTDNSNNGVLASNNKALIFGVTNGTNLFEYARLNTSGVFNFNNTPNMPGFHITSDTPNVRTELGLGTSASPTFAGITIADQITHSGDTNTFIRFSNNDTISLQTSGGEKVEVNSSGHLSIANRLVHLGDTDTFLDFSGSNTIDIDAGGVEQMTINATGVEINNTPSLPGINLIHGSNTPAIRTEIGLGTSASPTFAGVTISDPITANNAKGIIINSTAGTNKISIGKRSVATGSYSVQIGGYSANFGGYCNAPGDYQVAIGTAATSHASAPGTVTIGANAQTNNSSANYAVAIGNSARAEGLASIALGNNLTVDAPHAIGIGKNVNFSTGADKAIAIGYNADQSNANSDRSIAIGAHTDGVASDGIAIGYTAQSKQAGASSIGKHVTSNVAKVTEIGYWSDATTRGGAVTIRGETGQVSATLQNRSSAYTDGGATKGSEADNTLMREAYSIRRDGTKLFIDLNVGGTISTQQLGNASPTLTGKTTLEKVTMSANSFMTETSSFVLNSPHEGAIIFCNNTAPMTIGIPNMSTGFNATFIAKSNSQVDFSPAAGIGVNSFNGANRIAGFAGQASIIYDCPTVAFLGGNIV